MCENVIIIMLLYVYTSIDEFCSLFILNWGRTLLFLNKKMHTVTN
jgi:hypothetical protein